MGMGHDIGGPPKRRVSELEDILVHVRDYLEPRPEFKIKTKLRLTDGGEPALFSTMCKYTGSYVMNDKIVIMMEFDDTAVQDVFQDMSYGLVRRMIKDRVMKAVPILEASEIRVHVTDTSTGATDLEDDV